MRVKGNSDPYRHPHLPWTVGWRGPNGEAFEVDVIRCIADFTYLWRVKAIRKFDTPSQMTWDDVVANPSLSGPVQFSNATKMAMGGDAVTHQAVIDVDSVHKIGPVLYTTSLVRGDRKRYSIPVDMVSKLASHAVNRERDPHLLAELTYKAEAMARVARIPPLYKSQLVAIAAVLGLTVNLSNEIDLLHTVNRRFKWQFDLHRTLVGFQSPRVWTLIWCVVVLVCALALTVGLDVGVHVEWVDVAVSVVFVVLVSTVCCCWCCVRPLVNDYRRRQVENWHTGMEGDVPRGSFLSNYLSIPKENRQLVGSNHLVDPLLPDEVSGTLTINEVEPRRVLPTEQSELVGIVNPICVSSVPSPGLEADLVAVTHRVLSPKPGYEQKAVDEYALTIQNSEVFKAVDGVVDVGKKAFLKWVNGLKTYPVAYRDRLKAAWEVWHDKVAPPISVRAFVKDEKLKVTYVDGHEANKPRLIQPPEDADKALIGYLVNQLYKLVTNAWNGENTNVFYCSGVTTDHIGSVVDKWIEGFGGEHLVTGIKVDMSKYDSTLGIHLQDPVFRFYKRMGFPEDAIRWITRIRTKGTTLHGVKYEAKRTFGPFDTSEEAWLSRPAALAKEYRLSCRVYEKDGKWWLETEDFQMPSGRADTNLMDTIANVASTLTGAASVGVSFLLLACGDDAFILCKTADADKLAEAVRSFHQRVGLVPKLEVCRGRYEWEFCSKLFWFGKHPETHIVQTVLGAKPGRLLPRFGVTVKVAGEANIASSAQSIRVDCGHVPFIAPYADRTFELAREQRIRPKKGRYEDRLRASRRFEPVAENYVIATERYGYGKPAEDQLRQLLSQVDKIPMMLVWPPMVDMAKVDE